jgi:hypothetical protein
MSSIQGYGSSDLVASSYTSGVESKKTSDTPSSNWNDLSISQIRDTTDQMATSGQLTAQQQMALIGGGLQDPNAYDPGYQPTQGTQVGYSRSDAGTYDMVNIMDGAAAMATSPQSAAIYQSIAQDFEENKGDSGVSING